jgi:hypothetical protein
MSKEHKAAFELLISTINEYVEKHPGCNDESLYRDCWQVHSHLFTEEQDPCGYTYFALAVQSLIVKGSIYRITYGPKFSSGPGIVNLYVPNSYSVHISP